ncbi:hypothetical protein ACH5RR_006351 [Cinchona calisaya]|uniref:Uncharacterized protein n=1 Tax=Cinchona calisaya TaxID=153742 RepID=A0ABD3ANR5_9GENT
MFSLKAALLWTISDFPAYAMLSGWSTRDGKACPRCAGDTKSCWLKHGRKFCYTGYRRFLHKSDRMRKDKISFDGKMEWGEAPKLLSGMEMLQQLNGVLSEYKKEDLKKRRIELFDHDKLQFWKKKSIFFELPYWANNLVPHNLDIMHIEGNYCDNLLSTIMGLVRKSKDNLNSRRDLEELGIRKPLHPIRKGSSLVLPLFSFTLSRVDKDIFCKVLKEMKLPAGYGSNIARRVHDQSIWGLKTHDYHMLMQQLLPIAIRRVSPKNVVLSNVFR